MLGPFPLIHVEAEGNTDGKPRLCSGTRNKLPGSSLCENTHIRAGTGGQGRGGGKDGGAGTGGFFDEKSKIKSKFSLQYHEVHGFKSTNRLWTLTPTAVDWDEVKKNKQT